jgi:hypothetical protein
VTTDVPVRRLDWEALRNARDLGGLRLARGVTKTGAVVRSDTLRQLTPTGWEALVGYGVRTVVDLRFQIEIDADQPLDAGPSGLSRPLPLKGANGGSRPVEVRTVPVSLLGEPDRALGAHFDSISRAQPDEASSTRAVYLAMLELFPERIARAVVAVAEASRIGAVLVHCHAGKDRTGLVVALLLSIAGVEPQVIADDYALSGPNLASALAVWVEAGEDDEEREHRRRVALAPKQAMLDVLTELDHQWGGAAGYLLEAGASESVLERIRVALCRA